MVKNRARALATLAVLSTALFLTACGGGGGGETVVTPTPTPVVPVVNPPVLSVASTSPLPVASTIVVTSDKALEGVTQVSLINQLNAAIPANAVLSADKKSIVITPIANFTYATTITVTVKAKANGVEGTVTATVITENAPVVCTPPSMANSVNVCMQPPAATGYTWNNTIKAWVANIGVLVTSLNELPLECKVIGDACWKGKTADGTIKYFETNLVMTGFSARKIVFAGLVVSKQSGFAAGNFNLIPIYVDTESDAPLLNNLVLNGSNTDGVVTLKGSQNGVKFTTPANGCWEKVWVGNGFSSATTTCPI